MYKAFSWLILQQWTACSCRGNQAKVMIHKEWGSAKILPTCTHILRRVTCTHIKALSKAWKYSKIEYYNQGNFYVEYFRQNFVSKNILASHKISWHLKKLNARTFIVDKHLCVNFCGWFAPKDYSDGELFQVMATSMFMVQHLSVCYKVNLD